LVKVVHFLTVILGYFRTEHQRLVGSVLPSSYSPDTFIVQATAFVHFVSVSTSQV